LVALVAVQTVQASSAAIYYLVHSTLVTATLFILADLIARQRGKVADRITAGRPMTQPRLLGSCFLVAAVAVIGMPPLSGFISKVWLLDAMLKSEYTVFFWPLYLLASLVILVSVSKAGSTVFWHHQGKLSENTERKSVHPAQMAALLILVSTAPLMSLFAGPLSEYAIGAANQLHDFNHTIQTINPGGK